MRVNEHTQRLDRGDERSNGEGDYLLRAASDTDRSAATAADKANNFIANFRDCKKVKDLQRKESYLKLLLGRNCAATPRSADHTA